MKKTYTISIGGQIFHTEEDAGDKLQAYIQTLEKHYFQEEGGQEIMNDIENRIAELLQEATQKQNTEVVTLEDIQQVIQILGNPGRHYFRRLYGNSKRKNAPETLSRFRSQYAGRSSRRYC